MIEPLFIGKEVIKNVFMGNNLLKKIRLNFFSGRTTGADDIEKSFSHCTSIYEQYREGLKDAGLPEDYFTGKSIIEIGPGSNLGVELCFIANGARKANALDRFPDVQATVKEKKLYTRLLDSFQNNQQIKKIIQLEHSQPLFNKDYIQYYGECALEEAAQHLNREYDVAVSHLALEHVRNLDKGIETVAKLLKPGGICIFICNLVSLGGVYHHQHEPLRLLYYSESTWNKMFSNRGGSNRARVSKYKELLIKNGFDIIGFNVLRQMKKEELTLIKDRFDRNFRQLTDEDLSVLKFRITARLKG